jgi:hypothetical protein
MRHSTFILLFIFSSFNYGLKISAQTTADYDFSASMETFSSIKTFGTPATINGDDFFQTSIPLGFSFTYCGVSYPLTYASSNGYIQLINILPSSGAPSASNNLNSVSLLHQGTGMICPFWDDLDATGRESYYTTIGDAPNRVFIFEWVNLGLYGGLSGATADTLNFQLKLYETTNTIQFCYGSHNQPNLTATMGLINSTTDYQTLDAPSSFPTPSGSNFNTSINSLPDDGQVYTWSFGPASVYQTPRLSKISIYPNPSNGAFRLASTQSIKTIDIFDTSGKLISTAQPFSTNFVHTLLDCGIYIMRVVSTDGSIQHESVMIE